MRRLFALLPLALALASCGDAVTDPLRGEFAVDPAPVLGEWVSPPAPFPPDDFDALLVADAGRLQGYFEFALWGRWWIVNFRDATWDGETVRFVSKTDFGQQEADSLVFWEAVYVPGAGSSARRIALTASFGPLRNCCIVSMVYYRPGEVPAAAGAAGILAARRIGYVEAPSSASSRTFQATTPSSLRGSSR